MTDHLLAIKEANSEAEAVTLAVSVAGEFPWGWATEDMLNGEWQRIYIEDRAT